MTCKTCNGTKFVMTRDCCGHYVPGPGFDQPPECCGEPMEADVPCPTCADATRFKKYLDRDLEAAIDAAAEKAFWEFDVRRKQAEKMGAPTLGSRNGQAKFDEVTVLSARRLRATGWTYKRIAERFGVDKATARRACTGKQWSQVNG